MTESALELDRVSFSYPNGQDAVRELTLRVSAGERVGLVGSNGAGKTTILQLACGLIHPTAGTVRVLSRDLSPKSAAEIQRDIGFVFQETEDQLFCPSVRDDVAFGPENHGQSPEEIDRSVERSLAQVDLEGFHDRSSQNLSSGERRRVALASVLSYEPKLLLLDEPTSDLDPRHRREFGNLLTGLPQSALIASHDLEFVYLTCDRVVVVSSGRDASEFAAADLPRRSKELRELGLEAPLGLSLLDEDQLRKLREEWSRTED
ncbi:MAG: ABC transporter ATP-binding protein [Planctomycetota bacterium]